MRYLTVVVPVPDDFELNTDAVIHWRDDENCAVLENGKTSSDAVGSWTVRLTNVLASEERTDTEEEALVWARNEYASDIINIDDDAKVSTGDGGTWVQGWLYVSHGDLSNVCEHCGGELDASTTDGECLVCDVSKKCDSCERPADEPHTSDCPKALAQDYEDGTIKPGDDSYEEAKAASEAMKTSS